MNPENLGLLIVCYGSVTFIVWIVLSVWHTRDGLTWAHKHRFAITVFWPIFAMVWFIRKTITSIKTLCLYAYNGSF